MLWPKEDVCNHQGELSNWQSSVVRWRVLLLSYSQQRDLSILHTGTVRSSLLNTLCAIYRIIDVMFFFHQAHKHELCLPLYTFLAWNGLYMTHLCDVLWTKKIYTVHVNVSGELRILNWAQVCVLERMVCVCVPRVGSRLVPVDRLQIPETLVRNKQLQNEWMSEKFFIGSWSLYPSINAFLSTCIVFFVVALHWATCFSWGLAMWGLLLYSQCCGYYF